MIRPSLFRCLSLLLVLAACAGCSSVAFRTLGDPPCEQLPEQDARERLVWESSARPCAKNWALRMPTHGVNYVEIDEQGMLHDRAAAEDALRYAAEKPSKGSDRSYVVVYIHGWHHNAAPEDGNVQAFHSTLHAVKKWHEDADVRGIYIGWPGASLELPLLTNLTFWDRKNTSDEVGRGSLLEFLLRLERAVKADPARKNRLVLIGHSFGASVAFNALAHVVMTRFIDGLNSSAPADRMRAYGDLVVLINPAIEAMRYMPLQSAADYYSNRADAPNVDLDRETKPRLIILSSEGDWATRYTFRIARFVSTALEAHNPISAAQSPRADGAYSEWNMDRDTVGNYKEFKTHWPLRIANRGADADGKVKPLEPGNVPRCLKFSAARLKSLLQKESAQEPGPQSEYGEFPDSDIRVLRKPSRIKNSPYLIADVGTEIIADHSTIDSQNLVCWINQIVDAE